MSMKKIVVGDNCCPTCLCPLTIMWLYHVSPAGPCREAVLSNPEARQAYDSSLQLERRRQISRREVQRTRTSW